MTDSKQNSSHADDGKMAVLERMRKISKYAIIAGIVLLTLGIVLMLLSEYVLYSLDEDMCGMLILTGVAAAGIGALIKIFTGWLAKRVAVNYTPEALKTAFDRLDEYNHKRGISDSYIYSASAALPSFDNITGLKDYVKGMLRGINIEFSEFSLQEREEERDKDGKVKVTYTTVYSGILLITKHGYKLKQDIVITQAVGNLFGGQKTESIEFDKLFQIKSGDGHELFYLLTPQYMEKLIKLSNEKGKIFGLTLLKDGELILTMSGRNYFEPGGTSSVDELVQKIVNEMNELGDTLETLEIPKEGSQQLMGKAD